MMPYVVILELGDRFANRVYGPIDAVNPTTAVREARNNTNWIGIDDTVSVHPVGVTPDGELDGVKIAVEDVQE